MMSYCLELPDPSEWRKVGPEEFPEACLKAPACHLRLGDQIVDVHVEAIAVVYQDVGSTRFQVAAHDDYDVDIEKVYETVRLGAHDYVLRILPYEG